MSAIKDIITKKCDDSNLTEEQEKRFWNLLNTKSPGLNFCGHIEQQIDWTIHVVKNNLDIE